MAAGAVDAGGDELAEDGEGLATDERAGVALCAGGAKLGGTVDAMGDAIGEAGLAEFPGAPQPATAAARITATAARAAVAVPTRTADAPAREPTGGSAN
jgi:hypothetical protein